MKNPIEKIGLAATPEDWEHIQKFIDATASPGESTILAMLVWNYCSKLVDDEFGEEDDPNEYQPCWQQEWEDFGESYD